MFDLLIHGGMLLDGSGAAARPADIGVRAGRIDAVGDLDGASAQDRIDACGLTVAPGFIDIHTHSDFTLLVDGHADSQLCQGVTTEVIGQCGFSAAPLGRQVDGRSMLGYIDVGVPLSWRSFGDYLETLQAARPGTNVAAFVGHGALRRAVMGDRADAATQDEQREMERLAEEAFDAGAFGLSTGLEYFPGNTATAEELDRMARVASRRGALYATHVRNRDVDCAAGYGEALDTARRSGVRLQMSHIQPKFGAPPGAVERVLEDLDRARREGVDAAFDVIPHDWAHTTMASVLPAWAREGGVAATLARLADRSERERIRRAPAPIWQLVLAGRWQDIVLLRSPAHPSLAGLDFAEIARRRRTEPFDTVLDLLLEAGTQFSQVLWTSRSFRDADVCTCLRDAAGIVMSDTLSLSRRGPLANEVGSLSGYGWVARLLGHYVRERGVLSLAEAVHRISGRPAERLGLTDRGVVRTGAQGDLVIFDPDAVADRSSFLAPAVHPDGFRHVLVNGQVVVRDGLRNDARPGRVLRDLPAR